MIRAINQQPKTNIQGSSGSIGQTLRSRLPHIEQNRTTELILKLQDLHITKLAGLNVMMTAHGAENLQHGLTELGRRFIDYLTINEE